MDLGFSGIFYNSASWCTDAFTSIQYWSIGRIQGQVGWGLAQSGVQKKWSWWLRHWHFSSESVLSLCPSRLRGHGVVGGFGVIITHHLIPLSPFHLCWLVVAWLGSGFPGKQHFLAIISLHLPHQWAQPSQMGDGRGRLSRFPPAPGCKTRQVLVGEEWETPVFLLAVKGGMFSIFWFVRESI